MRYVNMTALFIHKIHQFHPKTLKDRPFYDQIKSLLLEGDEQIWIARHSDTSFTWEYLYNKYETFMEG